MVMATMPKFTVAISDKGNFSGGQVAALAILKLLNMDKDFEVVRTSDLARALVCDATVGMKLMDSEKRHYDPSIAKPCRVTSSIYYGLAGIVWRYVGDKVVDKVITEPTGQHLKTKTDIIDQIVVAADKQIFSPIDANEGTLNVLVNAEKTAKTVEEIKEIRQTMGYPYSEIIYAMNPVWYEDNFKSRERALNAAIDYSAFAFSSHISNIYAQKLAHKLVSDNYLVRDKRPYILYLSSPIPWRAALAKMYDDEVCFVVVREPDNPIHRVYCVPDKFGNPRCKLPDGWSTMHPFSAATNVADALYLHPAGGEFGTKTAQAAFTLCERAMIFSGKIPVPKEAKTPDATPKAEAPKGATTIIDLVEGPDGGFIAEGSELEVSVAKFPDKAVVEAFDGSTAIPRETRRIPAIVTSRSEIIDPSEWLQETLKKKHLPATLPMIRQELTRAGARPYSRYDNDDIYDMDELETIT